jgi:Tfp pilus assembly protein PilF
LELRPGAGSGEAIDSGRLRVLLNLADLLAARGRIDEARGFYDEAVRLQPRVPQLENDYGMALQAEGKVEQARERFERALRIDPTSVRAAYNLGGLLAESEDFSAAARWYRIVLELEPKMAEAHNNLGWVLAHSGRTAEAIERLESALELRPDWVLPAQTLAWLLATDSDPRLRDPARAIELMERALRRDASNVRLLETLAAAYAAAGDFDRAIRTIRTAIELSSSAGDPGDADRLRRQEALYAQGRSTITDR